MTPENKERIGKLAKVGAQASKLAKKAAARLEKKRLQIEQEKEIFGVAKILLANPAIAGTLAYIAVDQISRIAPGQPATSTTSTPISDFLNGIAKQINSSGAGAPVSLIANVFTGIAQWNSSNSINDTQAGYALVKGALITYIATGGNLAGILGSSAAVIGAVGKLA